MLKQLTSHRCKPSPVWALLAGLALVSLACSLGDSAQAIRIRKILPTVTPTGAAVAQAEAPTAAPVQLNGSLLITVTPTQKPHLPTLTPTARLNQMAGAPNQPVNLALPPATTQPLANPSAAPTATATPAPAITPANPAATPGVNPTPPLSSPNPNPTPTLPLPSDPPPPPKSEIPGWSFKGVRTSIDGGDVFVVGEVINNTGSPQQAVDISAVFYDARDRVIQEELDPLSHLPVEVVPVGARVPFELVVESPQPVYRLDLVAMSEPTSDPPRQDFQIANVSQTTNQAGLYCLKGQVQNAGPPLQDYLVVMGIAYNEQGHVASFSEYSTALPEVVVGDQTSPFEMCLDPLSQQIANYELRALGY